MRLAAFAIDGEQIFLTINDLASASLLLRARNERVRELQILEKMSKCNSEAKYLLGRYLEERSIDAVEGVRLIAEAAYEGYPPALYLFGAYKDLGEYVEKDVLGAMKLFRKAAILGHAHSMWIYGVAQIFGAPGVGIDQKSGLRWVRRSARLKFVEALESLAKWHENGEFGFSVDVKRATRLRQQKEHADAIQLT